MTTMLTEFTEITPAENLDDMWVNFTPGLSVSPDSPYYVSRTDHNLLRLKSRMTRGRQPFLAFLCGHRGAGKTTELNRLCADEDISGKYYPIYLGVRDFGGDTTNLTPDAIFLEIGRKLASSGEVSSSFQGKLEAWGISVVRTWIKDEAVSAELGANPGVWVAYFKALLTARLDWKEERQQKLHPKIQDLIGILNAMSQELKERTGRQLLAVIDDLEKGDTEVERNMHIRIFQQGYEMLSQPRFSAIYTVPVYFRTMPDRRIPLDQLYAFSALRLYPVGEKEGNKPSLDKESQGYRLIRSFIEKRIHRPSSFLDENVLDDIILMGGGLFRETARVVQLCVDFVFFRKGNRIEPADVEQVFHHIKKEYQPIIRGKAIDLLADVDRTVQGWIDGVEPYLQSRAVMEYENGDIWLDLRYVLKAYVRSLSAPLPGSSGTPPEKSPDRRNGP